MSVYRRTSFPRQRRGNLAALLWTPPGGTTFYQGVSGIMAAPAGALGSDVAFGQAVAGVFPSPAGTISRAISKGLAGVFPAIAGAITKQTARLLAGTMPSPSGTPGQAYRTSEAVAGIMGTITGALGSIINPIVAATRALGVIGSRILRIIGG